MGNQLLIHSAAIAQAIEEDAKTIQVPDFFITNGEQASTANVLPSAENSVPFGSIFDKTTLLKTIRRLKPNLKVEFVTKDVPQSCPGLGLLPLVNSTTVLNVLESFKPAPWLLTRIQAMLDNVAPMGFNMDNGVCFHHRDGKDWHDHCKRWSALEEVDGVMRRNCELPSNSSLLQELQTRVLSQGKGWEGKKWMFYCGDHQVPEAILQVDVEVLSRSQMLTKAGTTAIRSKLQAVGDLRDVWALIDFEVCRNIKTFAGNSVSTFSALQIALRQPRMHFIPSEFEKESTPQASYWYNSYSIPLADLWPIYDIPIAYTYTEASSPSSKFLLQASISSVRKHMPHAQIHILYHGSNDVSFQQWLQNNHVFLHHHNPAWKDTIEKLRLAQEKKAPHASHLSKTGGNYLGTWQRIDIPHFVHAEYCLFLDYDTVIERAFSLESFGNDLSLTKSISMAPEDHPADNHKESRTFGNAGVMLMNIPYLRKTHSSFLKFIEYHAKQETPTFQNPCPADQGAYLEFYNSTFHQMSSCWNWKAYWKLDNKNKLTCQPQDIKILHFHGLKPHDFVKNDLKGEIDTAIQFMVPSTSQWEFKTSMQVFLEAGLFGNKNFISEYCAASFDPSMVRECSATLFGLAMVDNQLYLQAVLDMQALVAATFLLVFLGGGTPKRQKLKP